MSVTNSKKKPTDPLTPVKTNISNDGDEDEMSLMGSPPLLPCDDPAEYKKLRLAASEAMPADFIGQFCARMLTDALWETRRYRLVATNTIKAELALHPDILDPQARVAHVAPAISIPLSAFITSSGAESIVSVPCIVLRNSTVPIWASCWCPLLRTPNSGKSMTRLPTDIG
jgi:hypothetical protein